MIRPRLPLLPFAVLLAIAACARESPAPAPRYNGTRTDFSVSGKPAFFVSPKAGTASAWVWYAPVIAGRSPHRRLEWLFNSLLDNQIAVAGVDIGESYGNQAGRQVFTAFARTVRARWNVGSPCLIAQSRGALMLYNWAADHPTDVRAIAAIYPVADVTSWPGLGDRDFRRAHGNPSAAAVRALLPWVNPIARVEPLARAGVALFQIAGTNDLLVPADRNAAAFSQRFTAAGGASMLVLIPGKGHEPIPRFVESPELLSFLLEHCR